MSHVNRFYMALRHSQLQLVLDIRLQLHDAACVIPLRAKELPQLAFLLSLHST